MANYGFLHILKVHFCKLPQSKTAKHLSKNTIFDFVLTFFSNNIHSFSCYFHEGNFFVFQAKFTMKETIENVFTSKLNLVDLAGSERQSLVENSNLRLAVTVIVNLISLSIVTNLVFIEMWCDFKFRRIIMKYRTQQSNYLILSTLLNNQNRSDYLPLMFSQIVKFEVIFHCLCKK